MGEFLGSLVSGIFGYMGTSDTNATNAGIAASNNQFNADQANIARNYATYMSNTAHQREVRDLKDAGLNPLLSTNTGASTPGGATATASGNPVMQNPLASFSTALDNYVRYKSVSAQNDLVQAQAEKIRSMLPAEKKSTEQGTKTSAAQEKYYNTQSDTKGVGATINKLIDDGMKKMIKKFNQPNADKLTPYDTDPFKGSVFQNVP